ERGDEPQEAAAAVQLEDRRLLGADQVGDDLLDGPHELVAVERAVEAIACDVEVELDPVLLLELFALRREPAAVGLDLPEPLLQLGARLLVLLEQGAGRAELLLEEPLVALEEGDRRAQPLVLGEQ